MRQVRLVLLRFGIVPAGFDEVVAVCAFNRITIRHQSGAFDDGRITVEGRWPVITFRWDLQPKYRLWVAWHELGHFYMHPFEMRTRQRHDDDLEVQADIFAAAAFAIPRFVSAELNGSKCLIRNLVGRRLVSVGMERYRAPGRVPGRR